MRPIEEIAPAFRGIGGVDGGDLGEYLLSRSELDSVRPWITWDELDQIAQRIQTLTALAEQSALVATPEPEAS